MFFFCRFSCLKIVYHLYDMLLLSSSIRVYAYKICCCLIQKCRSLRSQHNHVMRWTSSCTLFILTPLLLFGIQWAMKIQNTNVLLYISGVGIWMFITCTRCPKLGNCINFISLIVISVFCGGWGYCSQTCSERRYAPCC